MGESESVGTIKKLPPYVIEKIAAGEVILHPAAALKELIENSIDAKSTKISVSISQKGFEYLKVTDNGHGMCREDLMIVCKRFTTSKNPGSLIGISTFGFRGEGLASLSQSSLLTITSRCPDSPIGLKVKYVNGEPKCIEEVDSEVGTTVEYENLFYNNQVRLKTLMKQGNVHYLKCLEVVQQYSVQLIDIAFSFYRLMDTSNIQRVLSQDDILEEMDHFDKRVKLIQHVYGDKVVKNLIPFTSSLEGEIAYECTGLINNINSSPSNLVMTFVNDRLVYMSNLCSMLDNIYMNIIGPGHLKFIYLSIKIPLQDVDLNIHPSKRLVSFVNQYEIELHIVKEIRKAIEASVHTTDSLIHQTTPVKHTPNKTIVNPIRNRNDSHQSSIKSFLALQFENDTVPEQFVKQNSIGLSSFINQATDQEIHSNKSGSYHGSNQSTQEDDYEETNAIALLKKSVFVGIVDENWVLLQVNRKLFFVNIQKMVEEYIYYYLAAENGQAKRIIFEPKLDVSKLLDLMTEAVSIDKLDDAYIELLNKFGIGVEYSDNILYLVSFPSIIDYHYPDITMLVKSVNNALKTREPDAIARGMSEALSVIPEEYTPTDYLERILYNGLKRCSRHFPINVAKHLVIELASLDNLYKNFERC